MPTSESVPNESGNLGRYRQLLWRLLSGGREPESDAALAAWFAVAVEAMRSGVTIGDLDGRILYTNPAEAAMHGYTVADLLGQSVRIFAPPVAAPRRSETELRDAGRWEREGWNRRKDGSLVPVRLISEVLRDRKGEPVGIVTISEDLTEWKRTEEALRKSEESYRTIVEHASYGICRIGPDGRFDAVNAALVDMLEYPSADDLYALDARMQVCNDPEKWDAMRTGATDAGRIVGAEIEWRRANGTPFWVRVSGRALWGPQDEDMGLELIVEDITERHLLERQLEQAQKMEVLGQLTSGIAHDFNNVLGVILTSLDLLVMTRPSQWAGLEEDIQQAQQAARRGAAMIRQLLAFSRKEGLALRAVRLPQFLNDAVGVLRRLLPENIEVRVAVDDELPPAMADPRAVEQVLLNLATNARDAMPGGGTLHLRGGREWLDERFRAMHGWGDPGEYATIWVSDTGVGMDAETLQRVFEPFFTTKPAGVGTGLGLPMVYSIMKQHRGFVHAESEAGSGTTIKLWFPVARDSATPSGGAQLFEEFPRGSETILIVEDDETLRRAARRALERFGYTVTVAEDGVEGWETFEQRAEEIDLVLTDLVMPRLGGLELRERVLGSSHPRPVLVATGYSGRGVLQQDPEGPAVQFLQKPWSVSELVQRVRAALDGTAESEAPADDRS